ncbi:Fe-S cluster assembly ATPase SufC [Leptospira montravelensis]|uniref:Fe-S cluster assembly ATPase SufC n=1 Tax=Leptospira montravelensis TaxID=2484961 RepID=A0ABY2LTQ6_9LEPT|nr:Fe-S cluster assembly ATPase SufC [Leptospira montravelensis]TGK83546.1 Fe-S cluster assembly ATPase SufC [Leptospira montravelensis]TGL05549.1 Fe-S cluster assembly ATPase SufC [Leptospira montravelensis]
MSAILEIKSLHANVGDKTILRGVNLTIGPGEVHAIMGPNGSGKSTLSNVILGHPKYTVTSGDILFKGESILNKTTDERARLGLFLSFQYPTALPGVTIGNFLKSILKAHRGKEVPVKEFKQELKQSMDLLEVPQSFIGRYVNDGFSGGEKKRAEILQMSLLKPVLSILDETDSGLDIDALRIVSEGINANKNGERSILLITHYQRMLNYIVPDFVHVFADGRILETGGKDLSLKLEEVGYDWILEREGVK